MKLINYIIIALFLLSNQPNCIAQKTSPIDYIDAGVRFIELFKPSKSSKKDACIYEVNFKNKSNHNLDISIMMTSTDSIVRRLIIPPGEQGSIFSLTEGVYRYVISTSNGDKLKESEFFLNKCGVLEMKIE